MTFIDDADRDLAAEFGGELDEIYKLAADDFVFDRKLSRYREVCAQLRQTRDPETEGDIAICEALRRERRDLIDEIVDILAEREEQEDDTRIANA
jgi:uncharacterized protein YdcH (DUF465 family)